VCKKRGASGKVIERDQSTRAGSKAFRRPLPDAEEVADKDPHTWRARWRTALTLSQQLPVTDPDRFAT